MHREGVSLNDLPNFLEKIKTYPNLKVEGLMSHFASADNREDPLNQFQIENFNKALEICRENNIYPKWLHLANSDGLINFNRELNFTTLARTGLALYGISSDPNIKPVLILKSKIIQIKTLQRKTRVGYSGTYTTKKSITIGILPLGYYDGIDRRLSNKGSVVIGNIVCPIIGRVSMNITNIDLSKIPNPYIGEEVIVYSSNPKDPNSIENSAKLCKTIPYDILIHLAASTKRVVL